jgi:hypothetical protein
MNLKNELDRAGPIVDRVNAAIRDNPLAAGLIGAGVAWMLMGGAKGFGAMAAAATGAASMAGSAAANAGSALASGVAKAGSATAAGLKAAASDGASSIGSLVPEISVPATDKAFDAVSEAGATLGNKINSAAVAGRRYGVSIQSRLSDSLEKQPLLLGAIGLAIGAGIASTFATTSVESELMGEQGTAARETLQGLGDVVTDRAQKVVSEVKTEAQNQGLTPEAAKSAATDIGKKVKAVAGAGRESVAQSFATKPT